MMSPKWNDPDPGFVAMSQAIAPNPYHDAPFVPQHLMSPPIAYPEPLSPCLCAEPDPDSVLEPKSEQELDPEVEAEDQSEHQHEPEPKSEPSPPQEVKQEIAWSTIEAGLQGFSSVRPSTSSSSNGYIDDYDCVYYSDTVDAVKTVQSFPYPFSASWNSQSYLPMVGDITMGADGHITTQVAGNSGTAGYFSVFPTAYQPQPYHPSYGDDYQGTASSATASYGPSDGAASYGTASYDSNAFGNAYVNAYNSNPYNNTAYNHASVQGMTGSQMAMGYSEQYNPYDDEASQMPLSASMPTSMPATPMPGLNISTPRIGTASNGPVTPDCSLNQMHSPQIVPPSTPLRGDRCSTTFYRYVTPPHHTAGAAHYVRGEHQPSHVRGLSGDSDSGRSSSSRSSSSSFSSGASTAGYHRQSVLDSIPLHKLQAMQKIPLPPKDDNLAKDRYIVKGKQLKLSYGQIKAIANWPDAESTLRGRFRNFTKAKHERVRKPIWHEIDVSIPFISCSLHSHLFLTQFANKLICRNASSSELS